jgi:hypothetical protein
MQKSNMKEHKMLKTTILAFLALSASPAVSVTPEVPPNFRCDGPNMRYVVLREKNWRMTLSTSGQSEWGAVRAGVGEIYDETATKRLGSIHLTCTTTEVKDGKAESTHCNGFIKTDLGNLAFQTVTGPQDQARGINPYVVTGGSGEYSGMRGEGYNTFTGQPSRHDICLIK